MALVFAVAAIATAGAAVAALPAIVGAEVGAVTASTVVTTVAEAVTAVASATGAVASVVKAADDGDEVVNGKHFLTNDQRAALGTVQMVAGAVAAVSGLAAIGSASAGAIAEGAAQDATPFVADGDDAAGSAGAQTGPGAPTTADPTGADPTAPADFRPVLGTQHLDPTDIAAINQDGDALPTALETDDGAQDLADSRNAEAIQSTPNTGAATPLESDTNAPWDTDESWENYKSDERVQAHAKNWVRVPGATDPSGQPYYQWSGLSTRGGYWTQVKDLLGQDVYDSTGQRLLTWVVD